MGKACCYGNHGMLCLYRQLESESANSAKVHEQLEKTSTDLEACLGDLEARNIANMLLKQQVCAFLCVFKNFGDVLMLQFVATYWLTV